MSVEYENCNVIFFSTSVGTYLEQFQVNLRRREHYLPFHRLQIQLRNACPSYLSLVLTKDINISIFLFDSIDFYLLLTESPPQLECSSSHEACDDGRFCVPLNWKCDGERDCLDGSDELEEECGA